MVKSKKQKQTIIKYFELFLVSFNKILKKKIEKSKVIEVHSYEP